MQYCAVYINQGLNAHREAFSPAIIIEELLLQRFLHTLKSLNTRMDSLEFQIKSTERVLRNQITKSETLILGEVERVHLILDQHIHNQTMHTALA